MDQVADILSKECYEPFLVKGNSFCLGENHPLLGEIRAYNDGKIIGILSDKKSSQSSEKNLVLGLKNNFYLKFWSFSRDSTGDLYSLVEEINNPRKYYGGRGYDQPHFEQLIKRVNKKLCLSELYSDLEKKPAKEILDSLNGIERSLIESSLGNAITVKIFNYDSRSFLELIPLR